MGVIYIKEENPFAEFVKGLSPAVQAWGQREKEFSDLKNAGLAKTQYSNTLGDMMGAGFGYGGQAISNPYEFQNMVFNPQQPENPSTYRKEGFTPATFSAIADAYAPQSQTAGSNSPAFGNVSQIQIPVYGTEQQVQTTPGYEVGRDGNRFSKELFLDTMLGRISNQETGGRADAYTTANATGSGAYGKYQIMGDNWGPWSAEAGYAGASPSNPEAQEATARYKQGQYYDRYREEFPNASDRKIGEAIAIAWYAGPENGRRWLAGEPDAMGEGGRYSWDAVQTGVNAGPSVRQYANESLGNSFQNGSEIQPKQTTNTVTVAKMANIDLPQMTPKPQMKQQIKKQFYEDQRGKLNDKSLSRAERSAMARQLLIGDKEFDEQFEAAWEVKATAAMDEAYSRLQPYLTHPDRRTALMAAQAYDAAASKLGLKLPKMREFVNDLNPGEKIMPYDDGATTGFQAYNPMTGEVRVLSSMDKKLSPSDQQRQSNWEADYQYRMGRDNEDREVKKAQLDENQKNQRLTQINNVLKLLYVKDPMGNYVPMPGREQEIKALQDEALMLNGVGATDQNDDFQSPQYGSFADYQKGKPTLSPEEQQKEDEWQGKNRTAFKQGFNSLYPLYLSGQDSTLTEQQWRQYAYSIGVDPEPAIQAAKKEADKGKKYINNPIIR